MNLNNTKILLVLLQLVYLLLFFFNCFRYYYNSTANYWFANNYLYPVAVCLAVFALVLYRRNYLNEYKYLTLFFLWSLLTTIIRFLLFHDNSDFSYNFHLLTAVFIALPLALSLKAELRLKLINILMQITVISLTLIGLLALFLVVGRLVLPHPVNEETIIGMLYITKTFRLAIWSNPNLVGMTYLVTLWLALYLTFFSKLKVSKAFFSFCALVLWLVLLLSDSRTCIVAFAVSFSLYLAYRYYSLYTSPFYKTIKVSTFLIFITSLLMVFLLNSLAMLLIEKLADLVAPLVQIAKIPLSVLPQTAVDIGGSRPINTVTQGRLNIWINAIKTMFTFPYIFVIGTSVSEVANVIRHYSPYLYPHLHNSWLQVLVAYGIPGLILIMTASYNFIKLQLSQLFPGNNNLPDEIKMIPFIVLALLLSSLLESSLFNLSNIIYFENTWLFVLIGYSYSSTKSVS